MKHKRLRKTLLLLFLPELIFIGIFGWLISCAASKPKHKQSIINKKTDDAFTILSIGEIAP